MYVIACDFEKSFRFDKAVEITKLLDYALHSCFKKIFSTRDQIVVHHCMVFLISLLFLKQ